MTISGATGGSGTRAIANRYPVTRGLTGGTEKQTGDKMQLEAQGINGVKSTVTESRAGL